MASLDTLAEDWTAGLTGPRWVVGVAATAGTHLSPYPDRFGWTAELRCAVNQAYSGSVTTTASTWSLTGSQLGGTFIPPNPGEGSIQQEMILHAGVDPNTADALWWRWDRGGLWAKFRVSGVEYDAGASEYLPEHRWWRISESDGFVTWELSPDGLTWTPLAAWAPTFTLTGLRVTLRGGHWLGADIEDPDPTMPARFGALNIYPARPDDPATVVQQDGVPFLAVDVVPDLVTGTFTLDASDLDSDDLLAWSAAAEGTWENVVCDVASVRAIRGASELAGPLTTVDAGLATVVLSDTLRRFDPLSNADAIRPGTPLRLRAWGYDVAGERWDAVLFTATISDDGLSVEYQRDDPPLVTLQAGDLVTELVGWTSPGEDPPVGAGDNLLTRAQRILAEMDQPATRLALDVDAAAYTASHPAAPLAQPWEELTAAKDAELGRVWVDARNRLVVRTRRSELSGPVRTTLSDDHGDADAGTVHCCYSAVSAVLDTAETTNRAIGTRRAATGETPATVSAEDTASVGRWRPQVTERPQLEVQTDVQTAAWAEDLVDLAGVPQLRVASVSPYPSRDDLDNALDAWPAVCLTDLGDRAVVRYRPAVGPVVDRTVGVLGIEWNITPTDWTVRWLCTDAPAVTAGNPVGYFILDDSDLDSGDVLAPDTARVAEIMSDGTWY